MSWEAQIIETLQRNASKFLDILIYGLTFIGDELFFIIVAALIYWCFSKKFAFRLLNIFLISAGINRLLKSLFRRPRPFDAYSDIRAVYHKSSSWSFPSGHSGSIATICTQITLKAKEECQHLRTALVASIALTSIVMFSRMYLGQHYLTDVIVGTGVAIACVVVLDYLYNFVEKKAQFFWIATLPLSVVLTLILILCGAATHNMTIIEASAAYGAACLGYMLEAKYIKYEVKSGAFFKQLAKLSIGFGVAVIILIFGKLLLQTFVPMGTWFEVVFVGYLLYALAGLWVFLGAPATFKKIGL